MYTREVNAIAFCIYMREWDRRLLGKYLTIGKAKTIIVTLLGLYFHGH